MEQIYDIIEAYLWLCYRMPEAFPDEIMVREMEKQMDVLIQEGVDRLIANYAE